MNTHLAWYVARATGYVAWGLLTATVILGLLFATRMARGHLTPKWLLDLHQFTGGLSVAFTVLHLWGVMADTYVQFGWADVLVPFAASWRTTGVALGIVAMYLLIAIQLSSMWMRKLPRAVWKKIHMLSYLLFWVATFHFLLVGSDVTNPLSRLVLVLAIAAVVFLSLISILSRTKPPRKRPTRPVAVEAQK